MKNIAVSFASENFAGAHQQILDAIIKANSGYERSYGDDNYSEAALQVFKRHFGESLQVHYTFNGTGANSFGLSTMGLVFHSVLCADCAHLFVAESIAPEVFAGCRLLPAATKDGKIIPERLEENITRVGDIHHAQVRALSITQPTELGTVYSREELTRLIAIAKKHNLLVHMDGARLFNAAAALNCSLKELTTDAGVDVLTLGGTKSGMLLGEAVILLNPDLFPGSRYLLKLSMQLASKARFIACQFEAMLSNDLWYQIAAHGNAMAKLLAERLRQFPEIEITRAVETNIVIARFPECLISPLQERIPFYLWGHKPLESRLVCSFATTPDDIACLVDTYKELRGKNQEKQVSGEAVIERHYRYGRLQAGYSQ